MFFMSSYTAKSSAGLVGAGTGIAVVKADAVLDVTLVIVIGIGLFFGIIAQYGRDIPKSERRQLFTNAGALWLIAYALTIHLGGNLLFGAMAGLGVSLCGPQVLELISKATIALVEKLTSTISKRNDK